jgi:hypothetical protein
MPKKIKIRFVSDFDVLMIEIMNRLNIIPIEQIIVDGHP